MSERPVDPTEAGPAALRFECLKLALSSAQHGEDAFSLVRRAKDFEAYLSGADAKTPRQIITDALEVAGVR